MPTPLKIKGKKAPESCRSLALRVAVLGLMTALVAISAWPSAAQTLPPGLQQKIEPQVVSVFGLSPEATRVADGIGATSLLERLEGQAADGSALNLESLFLRQEIAEKVMAASLDVDSVNAIIDTEIEQIRAIQSDLQSRRDKAQNIINIASIVTGGALGVANTALQFTSRTANLGNGIGVGGGAASVVLSIIGIHKQNGGRRDLGDSPRMLARFFGRQPNASEAVKSDYPDTIWSYLNSAEPSQPATGTRAEQLIAKWRTEGRIQPDNSPKSSRQRDALSGNISQVRKLSIDELDDRMAMLLDIRARISLMKRDLSEILRCLSTRKGNQ